MVQLHEPVLVVLFVGIQLLTETFVVLQEQEERVDFLFGELDGRHHLFHIGQAMEVRTDVFVHPFIQEMQGFLLGGFSIGTSQRKEVELEKVAIWPFQQPSI